MKILFLEDDTLLAQSLLDELEEYAYSITWVADGDSAADAAYDNSYDLYLFDVNVPGINGFELLKSLRIASDQTPCIFLTSKNEIKDIKLGFELGADDYIKKPFDLDELLIRIEAKLPKLSKIQLSPGFAIDPTNYSIICMDKETVLAKKEFDILHYFTKRLDTLIETQSIIDDLYPDEPISVATFRVYMKNIKRHIEGVAIIENVRGVGYRFKTL